MPAVHPVDAYVGLGANLGDAQRRVRNALTELAQLPETHLLACSSLWRSAPVQAQGPDFINAVAKLRTRFSAWALLAALQRMEHAAGRQRPYQNAPRTLDLDLLFYGQLQLDSADLQLPHPRWMSRAFVLRPLQEVAPHWVSEQALAAVADQPIERLD